MKTTIFSFLALAFVLSFVACSKNEEQATIEAPSNTPDYVKLPDWVFTPSIDDGIAAAQCVKFSGNLSLDQQETTAKGRVALAQQIEVRAQVLDKTYQDKVEAGDKSTTGSVFQSISKQVTDQNLVGSKLLKTDFGTVNEVAYVCGLVGISSAETQKIFDTIVKNEEAPTISAKDEDILYQEFKAYKAQQDLDQALGNN